MKYQCLSISTDVCLVCCLDYSSIIESYVLCYIRIHLLILLDQIGAQIYTRILHLLIMFVRELLKLL